MALSRVSKARKIFNSCRVPWFATRGNHDYNSDDAGYPSDPNVADLNVSTANELIIRNEDWFRSIDSSYNWASHLEVTFDAKNPKGGYFFVDNYAKKHRLIYLNSEEIHDDEYGKPYVAGGVLDCFISGAVNTKRQLEFILNHAMNMAGKARLGCFILLSPSAIYRCWNRRYKRISRLSGDQVKIRTVVKAFQEGTALSGYAYALIDTDLHTWTNYMVTKDFTSQGQFES